MQDSWDVIVAGGSVAGLSAALMLGRSRRRVLVIDAGSPRNRFASHMHGVLGSEGVPPAELVARGRAECATYGVQFTDGTIDRIEDTEDGLSVTTTDGEVRTARALVVATGIADELPDVPGLADRWGVTVLHCPYCHGWEVQDQRLGVLATTPMSLHQAEIVRQWSDRITLFSAAIEPLPPEVERRLRSRGVEIVREPVAEVLGDATAIEAVRLADGREVAIDAIFTAGRPVPHDGFLAPLHLERADGPFGSFLAVDPMTGKTSHDRVWAVGNVTVPMGNVPMSIGAAAMTGGAVNATLVGWEFDAALHDAQAWPQVAPVDFWEERYAGADRVWSGRVNRVLSDVAAMLPAGRALDLGCGEGADVIWLAREGWTATGVDISPSAVRRAAHAAAAAGLTPDQARFVAGDLSAVMSAHPGSYWDVDQAPFVPSPAAEPPIGREYDLVTASFLHSPVHLAREEILRRAASLVAPGGHLLVTSHADFPPWSDRARHAGHRFLSVDEELAELALDPATWQIVIAETRTRDTTGPDGVPATLDDTVILVRRR